MRPMPWSRANSIGIWWTRWLSKYRGGCSVYCNHYRPDRHQGVGPRQATAGAECPFDRPRNRLQRRLLFIRPRPQRRARYSARQRFSLSLETVSQFYRLMAVVLISGTIAGFFLFGIQHFAVVPLIERAERFEAGDHDSE